MSDPIVLTDEERTKVLGMLKDAAKISDEEWATSFELIGISVESWAELLIEGVVGAINTVRESTEEPPLHIDDYLDRYASKGIAEGKPYRWWWNGDYVLAAAISSAARHVRKDGYHDLAKRERRELKRLERYMKWYAAGQCDPMLPMDQERWLHAEAMFLLGKWFSRLWD